MSTVHADARGRARDPVFTKGAPDVLLARCTEERVAGEDAPTRPTSADARSSRRSSDSATWRCGTLAVAYRAARRRDTRPPTDESVEQELVYLGLVGIIDPPRPEARAAIADAHAAGMRVLMITGDHPHTAARIAADLDIAPAGSRVVSGGELETIDDEALVALVRDASVYARVIAGAQAADRRRAPRGRADRRDDGRRRERRARAQVGGHRRRDGDHGHRRREGGSGHDPRGRQLRHDRRRASAKAAASSRTSASSCASCSRRTWARC